MKKAIDFKTPQRLKGIQEYANKHFEGNFSMAVRALIDKGLGNDNS